MDRRKRSSARHILISVDESEGCERALQWTLDQLYRPGDEIHFLRVVPRQQHAESYGAPPVDFLPQQDPIAYSQLLQQAETFIRERLLPKLHMDTDSIGNVLCKRAEDLKAVALVMSSQSKTRVQSFFLGSCSNYCAHHCS
eukprot:jgi/Astpho2/2094/Aster-00579